MERKQSEIPFQMTRVKIEPEYKNFEGWKTDITSITNYAELPGKMKIYIELS